MTALPIRIQSRRVKGWRMPENTVDCTRPGPWGNPYKSRAHGISAENNFWFHHSALVDGDTPLSDAEIGPNAAKWRALVRENLHTLRGKNLACWCKKPLPYARDKCHAMTLIELANG